MVETIVVSPMIRAVGLALLHFLWQGALIAAATAWVLYGLRRSPAASRYVVGCVALAVMAAVPIVTTFRELDNSRGSITVATGGAAAASQAVSFAAPRATPAASISVPARTNGASPQTNDRMRWLPIVVIAWLAGVVVMTAALASAWLRAHRVKRSAAAVGEPWRGQMAELVERLGLSRRIALAKSAAIDVPMIIGWLRPAVIVPASVLTGLTPSQLDAILTHELAHVRRHDYLVNVLQSAIETLLFYHPAVWWVSRRVRVERELCCDDLVLAICGDRIVYARALASLEELRTARPVLGMAATGGPLLDRIRRILSREPVEESRSSAWSVLTAIAAVAPIVFFGGAAENPTAAQPLISSMANAAPASRPGRTSLGTPQPMPAPGATFAAQTPTSASATAEQKAVRALEEEYRLAKVQGDVASLERLLDDAVVSTNQMGTMRDKAELLELSKASRVDLLSVDSADVRISGDLATVTGKQTEVNAAGAEPVLYTRIWRKAGSTWRLFSVTQFRDPNPTSLADGSNVYAVAPRRALRFEYELYRNDALLGRPSVSTVSGERWRLQIPGEPPVTATASIAGEDAISLTLVPGRSSAPVPMLTLRGAEPADASWTSGTSTYRIRIRSVAIPTPSRVGPVRIGGDIRRPEIVHRVDPVYPQVAKDANVSGMVIVEIVIDETGAVSNAQIIRSVPMLDAAALDAVRQWRYTPTLLNGQTVSVITSVNITFATR